MPATPQPTSVPVPKPVPVPPEITARLRAAGCVFAEDEARLLVSEKRSPDELEQMVQRRIAGEPLEYILGWAQFSGLRIGVEAGVFVPRRRTEFLVRQAVKLAAPRSLLLDLCCGSGAIGIAIASRVPGLNLYAADIDPLAVQCARRNFAEFAHFLDGPDAAGYSSGERPAALAPHAVPTSPAHRVFAGDLFDPLPGELRGRFDVLVVNAPYVPSDAIALLPAEARDHETRAALDGGGDGLDIHRRVAAAARVWLAPNGYLLVETSSGQAAQTMDIFVQNGLTARLERSKRRDATVVVGSPVIGRRGGAENKTPTVSRGAPGGRE